MSFWTNSVWMLIFSLSLCISHSHEQVLSTRGSTDIWKSLWFPLKHPVICSYKILPLFIIVFCNSFIVRSLLPFSSFNFLQYDCIHNGHKQSQPSLASRHGTLRGWQALQSRVDNRKYHLTLQDRIGLICMEYGRYVKTALPSGNGDIRRQWANLSHRTAWKSYHCLGFPFSAIGCADDVFFYDCRRKVLAECI